MDFKGGTEIQVQFTTTPNENHIRQALSSAGVKDSIVYPISDTSGRSANTEVISLPEASDASHDTGSTQVQNALNCGQPGSDCTIQKVDIVGPTAGTQLQHQAELATIYSLIGMLIYLWFRFELIYGVAAVVAVFHDTLITVGAFSLTNQEITPHRDRGHPDPDRILDERHHRGLRPHPREPAPCRAGNRCPTW